MLRVVKQYGEVRTGTNYLRALVQRNYPDVLVLSYILGDKHAPPVQFDAIWERTARAGADRAVNFVSAATYARPGSASYAADLTQRAEIARRAARIARAYSSGKLGFLATIKDPYAWIVSVAKFKQWIRGDEQLHEWDLEQVRDACLSYNRNYEAWVPFVRENQLGARVIRYEDLLADPEHVMTETAEAFDWHGIGSFVAIPAAVEPTAWDHLSVVEAPHPFRAAYYFNREYLLRLPKAHMQVIGDTMNWHLLREFGYVRL